MRGGGAAFEQGSPGVSTLSPIRLPELGEVLERAPSENFPVALRVLGHATRESLMAVYGFARLVDEVGDSVGESGAQRLAALDAVEAEVDAAFAGAATHPVFAALTPVIRRHGFERKPFVDLIDANRQDQLVASYGTFAQLLGYCSLSADPVGRLVLAVFERLTEERARLSDLICSGLQLVEHFQDVAEDAAQGRVYLPREDIDRFSVPLSLFDGPLPAGGTPASFRRLMAFETSRARELLAEGSALVGTLPPRPALAVAGFAGGGLAQLDAIERAGYDVLATRVKASKASVASHALQLAARWLPSARPRRGVR